tara:strand:- start:2643 stop:3440 length:798 start_codon:yes stop_codon:yes gene_type:complete
MSAPHYIGDTTWQRNPGGSQGTTEDGVSFQELVYAGRLDGAEKFIKDWPKGTNIMVAGVAKNLTLVAAPIVQDLDGVRGETTLRFEGVEQVEGSSDGTDSEQFTAEWSAEIKEVYLQPNTSFDRGKYSYLSPTVTYSYVDDHKRDLDPQATRFRFPLPWGATKEEMNNPNHIMQEICKPLKLVGWLGKDNPPRANTDDGFIKPGGGAAAVAGVKPISQLHKDRATFERGVWFIKQISGFSSIAQEGDSIFKHSEFHTLEIGQVFG